jgi:hypothetical protein
MCASQGHRELKSSWTAVGRVAAAVGHGFSIGRGIVTEDTSLRAVLVFEV